MNENNDILTLKPNIQKGFEGYAQNEKDTRFYGYVNIHDTICITYNIKDPKTDKGASFSLSFTNKDALHLENVLKLEEKTRRPLSETYHSEHIFMTCFVGSHPVISNSKKKYSFSFARNEDYGTLMEMLADYFEDPDNLTESEKKLRDDLKKERQDYIENFKKNRRF